MDPGLSPVAAVSSSSLTTTEARPTGRLNGVFGSASAGRENDKPTVCDDSLPASLRREAGPVGSGNARGLG